MATRWRVHVPLMPAAQLEAHLLMMASSNIFSPSDGSPIVTPSQDIVLGIAWMSRARVGAKGTWQDDWQNKEGEILNPGKIFPNEAAVILAHQQGEIDIHAKIKLQSDVGIIDTVVGRVLLADDLPGEITIHDVNRDHDQSTIGEVIAKCYAQHGHAKTVELLDHLKAAGFKYATLSGLSIAMVDMTVPPEKPALVDAAQEEVERIDDMYQNGLITEGERYNKIIDEWTRTTELVSAAMLKEMEKSQEGFSGIYLMYQSKARGSKSQIRQLAAMRGLMAKPSGDIIESPIKSNFREGLTVVEYFISSHGARKGLADTALKTADAGYLTRRLVDVAQDVSIEEIDCGTLNGVWVEPLMDGADIIAPIEERIVGRYALEDIMVPGRDEPVVTSDEEIDEETGEADFRVGSSGGDDPVGAYVPVEAGRVRQVLWAQPGHGQTGGDRRGGGDHRGAVDRRAGHAVDDAHLPYRRRREPAGRKYRH